MGGNNVPKFREVEFQGMVKGLQLAKTRRRHGNPVREVLQG